MRPTVMARNHMAKPAPPTWPLPQASISPKLLTLETRAIVAREVARFDAQRPIQAAPTPPSSWYLSPLFAQAELASIFARSWQFACRLDQVNKVGDFVATFIGQEPVVVVRADDGSLKAYRYQPLAIAIMLTMQHFDDSMFFQRYDIIVSVFSLCSRPCCCFFASHLVDGPRASCPQA